MYYGNPDGTVLSFMQRLFYSCGCDLHIKAGASVVSCRRGGNGVTFEAMNQFFGTSGMPTVLSTYWNDMHGYNMATNMAFMLKSIEAGKEKYGKPDVRHTQFMSFIR